MTRFLIFSLFSILCLTAPGQTSYAEIDARVKDIPRKGHSISSLAQKITSNYTEKDQALRAIYAWIAFHVDYDIRFQSQFMEGNLDTNFAEIAFKKGRGVCQHYSALFKEMGEAVGLEVYQFSGYTRGENQGLHDVSHAWNAAIIEDEIYFFDPTWAAGYVNEDGFQSDYDTSWFMVSPEDFFKTHRPFLGFQQGLDPILNHRKFAEGRDETGLASSAYLAEIRAFEELNRKEELKIRKLWLEKEKHDHPLIQEELNYVSAYLESTEYNLAADKLNQAIDDFNAYQTLRRKGMNPSSEVLSRAYLRAKAAREVFYRLNPTENQLKALIRRARKESDEFLSILEKAL